jgi:hypothetical protein
VLVVALVAAIAPVARAAPAPAQERQARELYRQGVARMQATDIEAALPLLQKAYQLGGYKNALWNLSECYRKLSRFTLAMAELERFRQHPRTTPAERETADAELALLRARIATLKVESNLLGAAVAVDGHAEGRTPLELPLDPGRHLIEVSSPGFSSGRAVLELAPGERRSTRFELQTAPVRLEVRSRPPGARISVASRVLGVAPLTTQLEAGTHEVRAELDGFRPARKGIAASPGEHLVVELELLPRSGALLVKSDAAGARVRVDGRVLGEAPVSAEALAPGRRLLQVERPGYQPWSGAVSLDDGRRTTVDVQLRRGTLDRRWMLLPATVAVAGLIAGGVVLSRSQDDAAAAAREYLTIHNNYWQLSMEMVKQMKRERLALVDGSDRQRTAGAVLLAVGGAAAVTAAVMAVFTPWRRSTARLEITGGPGVGAGVETRWP